MRVDLSAVPKLINSAPVTGAGTQRSEAEWAVNLVRLRDGKPRSRTRRSFERSTPSPMASNSIWRSLHTGSCGTKSRNRSIPGSDRPKAPLDHRTHALLHQRQTNLAAIGGPYTQTTPARNHPTLLDQRNQMRVDLAKCQRADLDAGFTKRLCRDNAQRIGAVAKRGKETVEFRLDGALQPGHQESQYRREVEDAVACEKMRLEASRLKKFS